MCGISGAAPGIEPALLRKMTNCLAHRGPDGEDYFHSQGISFGHRRLAIIDIPGGRQPMSTSDGRYTIAFNGEVYNFMALRKELETLGHRFSTRSDTEVLLQAYAQWGRGALERLRGMFAFAIWDAQERTLFIARDRLGVKPLFYTVLNGHQILFASELKSILQHPDVSRRVNYAAVDNYLTYLYIPAPQTIFEGIAELPPAHFLEWKNDSLVLQRYWDALPAPAEESRNGNTEARVEELKQIFTDAVRMRLVSDVPLGAFLSGGIDSSSIVAAMSWASGEPVRTFSLGFRAGEEQYSELEYARLVSSHCHTTHRELEIQPHCAELLPRIVRHFDQPFGNPTALLIYQLAELTRKDVTVALAGDAGDEVFLGYPRYQGLRAKGSYEMIPRSLRSAAAWMSGMISDDLAGRHTWRRLREFLSTGTANWRDAYFSWVSYFSPEMRASLYTNEFRQRVTGHDSGSLLEDCFDRVSEADPLNQASYADLHTFLPFNLLAYGDRMSMAHSLEVRLPFTDHKLVEFALALPAKWKLAGRETKYLLRKMAAPMLPAEILNRPKLGLNPPLGIWLSGELSPLLNTYLSEDSVKRRGWFRPQAIAKLLEDFRSGHRDYSLHIWSLLVLEEWCRQFLDGQSAEQSSHELMPAAVPTA